MTAFADWAAGLCAAGVACAILHMLCPDGALREALRVVTALLFFCCLLSPLGMLKEWLADGILTEEPGVSAVSVTLSERVEEQAITVIEDALLRDARGRLKDMEIKRVEVVRGDGDEAVGISVDRVRVVFAKEAHPVSTVAVDTLEQAWGIPVEVYYSDGTYMDDGV